MYQDSKKTKSGFTLVEILIYLAIFAVITTTITGVLLGIFRTRTIITDRVNTSEDMRLLLKSMRDDMYLGASIFVPGANTLEITDKDGDLITYTLTGTSVTRRVNAGTAIQLTADSTDVRNFLVLDASTPGSAGTVRITVELANFPRGTLQPEITINVTSTISLKFT